MDKIFTENPQKQFEFDAKVAGVFDDMVSRSIPYYKEVLGLCADFTLMYLKPDSTLLDLGTSTGAMLVEIASKAEFPLNLYGIDNAESMLEIAQNKLSAFMLHHYLFRDDENTLRIETIINLLHQLFALKRADKLQSVIRYYHITFRKIYFQNIATDEVCTHFIRT